MAKSTAARSAQTTADPANASLGVGSLSRTELLLVIGLTAASAVVNLVDLASRSLWNDELHSALIAVHHGISLWSAITADGGNMMLYYLLLHCFVALFGGGQLALRVPSALAGVGLTPVIFLLARRMFGSQTAAIATAIVAVSPALVLWNQQARGYALGTLLITLSLLALLRAFEFPRQRRWCLYGVLLVLSIYTLAYAALFVVAQWLALAFWPRARRQAKPMLTVAGVATLAYMPLIALTLRTGAAGILAANAPPSTTEGVHILEELTSGAAPDLFAVTLLSGIVTVIGLLCFVAAGAELLSRVRRAPGELETVCLGIALSWLFVPLLLDTIFSLAYRSIFNSSFLLQSVPAGAMVIAFVFAKLLPKGLSLAFTITVVTLLVAALVPTYGISYEQWSQASREIRNASRPGDCLMVNRPGVASNLAYYFSLDGGASAAPQLVLPALTWSEALDPTFSESASGGSPATVASFCKRLWIVINRVSPAQVMHLDVELSRLRQHGYKLKTVSRFIAYSGFYINVAVLVR